MAHQHPPRFLKIVDDAKTRVAKPMSPKKARMDRGEKFLLIDVREESEFAKDHLPEAIHLGKGIIERDVEARVPDLNTEMILTAAAVLAPRSPPTICRKWAIPM